jgi:hypothetical protein
LHGEHSIIDSNKTASNLVTVAERRANAPRCTAEKGLRVGSGAREAGSGFPLRENGRGTIDAVRSLPGMFASLKPRDLRSREP